MADIMLRTSSQNQVTCVANAFIDDYMKDANGEYVKIYLYLLRCLGRDDLVFSISEVADHLDHTEKDVMRAFTYWEKVGLLRLEYDDQKELSGISLVDVAGHDQAAKPVVSMVTPVASIAPTVAFTTTVGAPVAVSTPTKPNYSSDEIKAFSSQDSVMELIFVTEHYLGRPLSNSDTNSILYWYDSLDMSIDLIEYLIEYCLDNGHTSFHYMDTVARNWVEDGISTVEEAKTASKTHTTAVYSIMRAMGISGRSLNESELSYVDKWTNTLGFNIDIISEACTRTIASTNKPSFKYADSILMNWHKANAKTFDAIAALDEKHVAGAVAKLQSSKVTNINNTSKQKKNSFHNYDERKEDLDAIANSIFK